MLICTIICLSVYSSLARYNSDCLHLLCFILGYSREYFPLLAIILFILIKGYLFRGKTIRVGVQTLSHMKHSVEASAIPCFTCHAQDPYPPPIIYIFIQK